MAANESTKPARSLEPSDREIAMTRVYDAPPELVWKVWTEPEHISKWWGPDGFTTTTEIMDVRSGGEWRHVLHGPDGTDYQNRIIYVEVVRPERIVYDHVSFPPFRAFITFTAVGEKTELSMRMVFETAELRDKTDKTFGAVKGQKETLGRMEEYLAALQEGGKSR